MKFDPGCAFSKRNNPVESLRARLPWYSSGEWLARLMEHMNADHFGRLLKRTGDRGEDLEPPEPSLIHP